MFMIVVATIACLGIVYYFLPITERGPPEQQTRDAQHPDHQESRMGSSASAPDQSVSPTQASRSSTQGGHSDEPGSDEPAFTLPSPLAAAESELVPTIPEDDKSQHEFPSSVSDFTFGSDELTSTPPGSNSLALSVSSDSPHVQPVMIRSLQDRRPLTPINPDIDHELPFYEQSSPPFVFVGFSTSIPPFVRPASPRDPVDSLRSSQVSNSQPFETDSTYEHIRTAPSHNQLGIDEAPGPSEGEVQSSSERAVDV
ncbi:hypothetical protein M407DRAFT_21138 [Tulasnella calospora MUT 4182]|uniref:Uncharacterized protein n=1 Tax=Tulasnella calospora MUT 4182 TaxID=1051891 RepID=A0A0C3QQB4_9AGAM|nr:hypothetical protein M407DRAFT_21138 [Tulasnella calospora MUT 4182]